MAIKLIPFRDLRASKGIAYSRSQLYRLIKAGKFPRPIALGENRRAFVESELDEFLESKIAERDAAIKGEVT
jgi:prophage regulatory protein